ncbi:MAG: c-type cytochrome biogenesis protein CcsB [Pseudolysinimonas sp.]|uniref:c-type cytochrome biogenesis protein CcsB n=1 Tax=Pseudolysinimonas sp. TaxID=2680009 RepID=UPI003C745036
MTSQLDPISLVLTYSAIAVYVAAFLSYVFALAGHATNARRQLVSVGGPTVSQRGEEAQPEAAPDSRSARVGYALTALGWVLHLAAAVVRGVAAERVPWANMFEFSLTGTLLIVAVFLVVSRRARILILGPVVVGLVILLLGGATVAFYVPVIPLPPALESAWLVIHVLVALLATAFFGIAAVLSVTQLVKARHEKRSVPAVRTARLLDAIPAADYLDRLAYRLTIIGFALWTFTLMAGAIWAGRAWGRYWGWDVKEVWTFVIWVVYAAYVHAKATRGWEGNRAAWLSIIGFAAVLFNFGVVNVFFTGLHSYSGL